MYKMTLQHREKIGKANKRGVFIPCPTCNKDVYVTPWEKSRGNKYCSKQCFWDSHKIRMSGNKNPAWKGDIEKRSAYFKRMALQRDNYTCRECGYSEKIIMEVDHITPLKSGGKTTLDNLQTLCPNCHRRKTQKHFNINI